MKKKTKTKKNRRYKKKLFRGGSDNNVDVDVDNITAKIQSEHSLNNFLPDFNLGDSHMLQKFVELYEGLAIKTIESTANFLNVDLNDSERFKQRLEELKNILNDPKNKALMRELIANFSQVGIVALEASSPFVDKLITEIIEKLNIIGTEFGKAGVKIALNTLGEIPGYGVIIGTIRSASNAAEAFLASSNAFSQVVTSVSDNANATVQTLNSKLKEKEDLVKRTTDSVDQFKSNLKSSAITGGYNKNKNKKNNITKKVRFKL